MRTRIANQAIVELAFFPEFAGNLSAPNNFSYNLLSSIASYQGTKPHIRVGGNTQDYALYNSSLPDATFGIVDPSKSPDYPTTLQIGKSFFESYQTWPDVQFSHGYNLAKNSTEDHDLLLESASVACKALGGGKLLSWELGNEPDLYKTSSQGHVRPPSWNESDYVNEWLNLTGELQAAVASACPDLAGDNSFKFITPSFAGTSNSLNYNKTWAAGLNTSSHIFQISSHNYIAGATQPGVTLAGTLMNHTRIRQSVDAQVIEKQALKKYGHPFILGEANSLYNQGAPGLSNSFGAALWGVDFNLYCASQNISRVFMHQGLNYRYNAWQPIDTNDTAKGTKAPFYGNIAVAAMLGKNSESKVQIRNLPLLGDKDAAYAAYENNHIARIMAINLRDFNYTGAATTRPNHTYAFSAPTACSGLARLEYLHGNGSNAVTGLTWAGYSFNQELENGKPVRLQNVTEYEMIPVDASGGFAIDVPDSSAAMVTLTCR